MEEITMEKLLENVNEIIADFNKLVANKDVKGVKKALSEIERLISDSTEIELDNRENEEYDHVLHELLSQIGGKIEILRRAEGIDSEPGKRMYTNAEVKEMIAKLEEERKTAQSNFDEATKRLKDLKENPGKNFDSEYAIIRSVIDESIKTLNDSDEQIKILSASIIDGEEYSSLSYIDENLKVLQEERINLVNEGKTLNEELKDLRKTSKDQLVYEDPERIKDVSTKIRTLKGQITRGKKKIDTIEAKDLSVVLEEQDVKIKTLEARLGRYNDRLSKLGSKAIKTREKLMQQIEDVTSQITRINENKHFLSSFYRIREIEETIEGIEPTDYSVTFPGRLNDEEIIRKVLGKEPLNMSKEEIDAHIDEYRIIEVDSARDDNSEDDYPIALRQVVKIRKEPIIENITIGEIIRNLESEIESHRVDHVEDIKKVDEEIKTIDEKLENLIVEISSIRARKINEVLEDETVLKENKEFVEFINKENNSDTLGSLLLSLENELLSINENLETAKNLRKDLEAELKVLDENTELSEEEKKDKKLDLQGKIIILNNQISENEAKRIAISGRIEKIKTIFGISSLEEKLKEEKEKKADLKEQRSSLENDLDPEGKRIQERLLGFKEINGITNNENQSKVLLEKLLELEQEKEVLVSRVTVIPGIDNSKRIAEIQARIKEINARIKELDTEIVGILGIEGKEELDVSAEVARIGDEIFKTAKIRRELAEREVSPEEFLKYYIEGRDVLKQKLLEAKENRKEARETAYFIVNEGKFATLLNEALSDEYDCSDLEKIMAAEQIRQNLVAKGLIAEDSDYFDQEIETIEQVKDFKENVYDKVSELIAGTISGLDLSIEDLEESIHILDREISTLQNEIESEKVNDSKIEEVNMMLDKELSLRDRQAEASMFGDEELQEEYDERYQRFMAHKKISKTSYLGEDGQRREVEYEHIESYDEYEEDARFLNLADFSKYLTVTTLYRNSGNDPYAIGMGAKVKESDEIEPGMGTELLENQIREMEHYVSTYHGQTNNKKVLYETLKTAGSMFDPDHPIRRDQSFGTNLKNFGVNALRFLGLRLPKMDRYEDNGKAVNNPLRNYIGTFMVNGLVIAGVAASTILVGPALPIIGYASKGIVGLGNLIASKIVYHRNKEEIDENKPDMYTPTKQAKEVARKQYYRKEKVDEEGNVVKNNRFVAWLKAKTDRLPFFAKRRNETEKAIVELKKQEERISATLRAEEIKKKAQETIKAGKENQEIRMANQSKIAKNARTYNDIVRQPDTFDMTIARREVALASVFGSYGKNISYDVNPDATIERKDQYVKDDESLERTSSVESVLGTVRTDGNSITEEQVYTGKKQKVDFWNRVAQFALTTGLYTGYKWLQTKFQRTETVPEEVQGDPYYKDIDAEYKDVVVKDYATRYDTEKTCQDVVQANTGKTFVGFRTVSGGERNPAEYVIQGNEKITAMWQNDGSEWGTGVGDVAGLSQSTGFIDRTVGASMMDSTGVMNQKLTIDQIAQAVGLGKVDYSTLDGTYVSLGDNMWFKLSDLMKEMTKQVEVGSHIESQLVKEATRALVPGEIQIVNKDVLVTDWGLLGKTIGQGMAMGAGLTGIEQLHEIFDQTYIDQNTPGSFEERSEEAHRGIKSFDSIVKEVSEEKTISKEIDEEEPEELEEIK